MAKVDDLAGAVAAAERAVKAASKAVFDAQEVERQAEARLVLARQALEGQIDDMIKHG
jgi:hypothetical protein